MIFIASPFWHDNEDVRQYRRKKSSQYAMQLFKRGILCYAPLVYTTDEYKDLKSREDYWIEHGKRMVLACDEVRVLCLDGWDKSRGVQGEIESAENAGLKVKYIYSHTRLSFHGSRSLKDRGTSDLIKAEIEKHNPSVIVTHGEPDGVCALARKAAKQIGISLKLHHLQNDKYAQGMHHHRSVDVLQDSDFAVFIHDGVSKGTQNEYDLGRKMNVPHSYYVRVGDVFEDKTAGDASLGVLTDVDIGDFNFDLSI